MIHKRMQSSELPPLSIPFPMKQFQTLNQSPPLESAKIESIQS